MALRTKFLGLIPHLLGTETIYVELSEMLFLERHECIYIMSIKKFNKAVENYKSHSVIQNLCEMRGAVIFLLRPKTTKKSKMGRNHKTVHTTARYFQSNKNINLSQKLIQFHYMQRPHNLTYQFLRENKQF